MYIMEKRNDYCNHQLCECTVHMAYTVSIVLSLKSVYISILEIQNILCIV